jgi:hypothetical protein
VQGWCWWAFLGVLFSCKATLLTIISHQQAGHTKGKLYIGNENCKKTPFQILLKTNIGAKNARKPISRKQYKSYFACPKINQNPLNMRKTKGNSNFFFPLAMTSIYYNNTHLPELCLLPNKYKHTGHTSE